MKRFIATAACLVVGLLSSSVTAAAPTFEYRFNVDSVEYVGCAYVPPETCAWLSDVVMRDLGSLTITFSFDAWKRGTAEYDAGGFGYERPFVNTGVLDFGGASSIGPYFVAVEPPPGGFGIGYTTVDVDLSDLLSGGMQWLTIETVVYMGGTGTKWAGIVGSERYMERYYDFTGYWARVPEPSSIALLGISLAGLAFTRRRMR